MATNNKNNTGKPPLTAQQLQEINNRYFPNVDITQILNYPTLKRKGWTDDQILRYRKNQLFKEAFSNLDNYNELKSMPPDSRDAYYIYNYALRGKNNASARENFLREVSPENFQRVQQQMIEESSPAQRRDWLNPALKSLGVNPVTVDVEGKLLANKAKSPKEYLDAINQFRELYKEGNAGTGVDIDRFNEFPEDVKQEARRLVGLDSPEADKYFQDNESYQELVGALNNPSVQDLYRKNNTRDNKLGRIEGLIAAGEPLTESETKLYNDYIRQQASVLFPTDASQISHEWANKELQNSRIALMSNDPSQYYKYYDIDENDEDASTKWALKLGTANVAVTSSNNLLYKLMTGEGTGDFEEMQRAAQNRYIIENSVIPYNKNSFANLSLDDFKKFKSCL